MLDTTKYEETTISTTPACQEDPTGVNYRGNLSRTIQDQTCQAWTSQDPYQHTKTPANYPNAGLDNNYCRNLDMRFTAWCFTTNPGTRWDFCAVGYLDPKCQATPACQEDPTGVNYRGNLSQTINNHTCQAWTSQDPHEHANTPADFPNAGLDENYCRNPNIENTAWCYTTDPETRWEYCAVGYLDPRCQATPACQEDPTGVHYRGLLSRTIGDHTCQAWTSQDPNQHTKTPANYPNAGLDNNYCRNPDGVNTAWCYTTNPETRWEYCAVGYLDPRCQGSVV
ncbi:plasminogen-like [Strongylocentrotus purpuratus]|uniref:Kringle domain-containing protein n=1 Tax=Strongylocentrotus purpuratus TaxID=7668 RepID=A0A7M7RF91_STRPU|nr:plasminogen-like [Strongylocentrotus purpuratus]|eukprot:XP_798048.3 PREDICTED: plasminogen-like [Strongylocentrotus purpuratus]